MIYTMDNVPLAAVSAASHAAAEKQGMGALHVGSHVLFELLNEGHVVLTDTKDHPIIECWKHTTVTNMRPQMTAEEAAEIAHTTKVQRSVTIEGQKEQ